MTADAGRSRAVVPAVLRRVVPLAVLCLQTFALSGQPADAQAVARWTETIAEDEEGELQGVLIRALRQNDWLTAADIADRYRGAPTSGFSQYQAFLYAMTGRPDLVADMQDEGRIPASPLCEDETDVVYRDALEVIVEHAANHRAVIIQEFHWEAQHRLLLSQLLPRLRELGYDTFAAEDFEGEPAAYQALSHPGGAPAFHSAREPVFADAVRSAMALGYRLVPYEASFPPPPEVPPQEFQIYRSEQQAEHLHERIFAHDSESKALIYVGVGWGRERGHPDYPGDVPMVARLKELTGVDPVTVDQTGCRLRDAAWPSGATIAFDSSGVGAVQGHPVGTFDLQIRYGVAGFESDGRADWLAQLGRKPVPVPDQLRSVTEPVVIEARLTDEPAEASPSDRLYLRPDEALPLMLSPGDYRLTAWSSVDGGMNSIDVSVE